MLRDVRLAERGLVRRIAHGLLPAPERIREVEPPGLGNEAGLHGRSRSRTNATRRTVSVLLIAAAGWGCVDGDGDADLGQPADGSGTAESDDGATACSTPAELPDPDDPFFLHPELLEAIERSDEDPEIPFDPGATGWEVVDAPSYREIPPASVPEATLELWLAALTARDDPLPEVEPTNVIRLRESGPQHAVGAVLRYGYPDDSVGGEGWYLELRRQDDGWEIVAAARRWFCRRGVTGSLCL